MNKLYFLICENFDPELKSIIDSEGFDDVLVKAYPCMCENKRNKVETKKILDNCKDNNDDGVILCSKYCDILKLIPENNNSFTLIKSNYCFNHLADENIINYVIEKGGYIIGLGWLNNWRDHLEKMGFTREIAISFYKEICNELVFFDGGIDPNAKTKLEELSNFLELPYVIIPIELETLKYKIKSIVLEWRLHNNNENNQKLISEAQAQCAEYATILDILGKIASSNSKREAVDKFNEIFVGIMGATKFRFYNDTDSFNNLPLVAEDLLSDKEKKYVLLEENNMFFVRIDHKDRILGIIEAGEFIFPQYLKRYLNFALSMSQICGLAIVNIENYEAIIQSKEVFRYKSYHDSLTGLYNRTYFSEIIHNIKEFNNTCIFSFDIDELKFVNDTFGHLEGDKHIISTGNILKKYFRETDTVARIGGDEFIAVVPECSKEIAETLVSRLEQVVIRYNKEIKEPHLRISFSIGYALGDNSDDNIETLMKKSDDQMYAYKKSRKKLKLNKI